MSERDFDFERDLAVARDIHRRAGLDPRCFPDLEIEDIRTGNMIPDPLFLVKKVYENGKGRQALMSFLKVTSELYLLVDHEVGTPDERWQWLKEFKDIMAREAWVLGLDQMTAFVPIDVEKSFEKRLTDMGFIKSPWQSYTLNLR